ncbi:MAG: DegV family EDD domain-containing protein [Desulfobacterales bacterium]|nr:DegV family EDD domain-containing protein [Desulfobacterales bacterium]
MYHTLMDGLALGYERIVAWADILDRINVYPVPDGDTGRNLVITLGACRNINEDPDSLSREILLSARGNSGNIVAGFLAGFLTCKDLSSLPMSAEAGRNLAYQAVPSPQQGTMISLFDTLVTSLKKTPPEETGIWVEAVIHDMEETVRNTREQLPELKKAGVVDAGALGMLVFFDPLLNTLAGRTVRPSLFADDLKDSFNLSGTWQDRKYQGYCLDVLLKIEHEEREVVKHIMDVGESVVAMPNGECLKVHLHATDRERTRQDLTAIGAILSWAEDDLAEQTFRFSEPRKNQTIHIMTDAAGSMTRDLAQRLGITLLNSYIAVGNRFLPETYVDPSQFFAAMKAGAKVSTSQASVAERHECYNNVMKFYDRVLYLCVGSFYTGNYDVAIKWKSENDPEDRMTIIDTGIASGKLGLVARAVAELSLTGSNPLKVIAFAREVIQNVQEYIFLDRLQFLAAGGRISKTSAFFGDVLHIKPIVSPFPDGARKVGVVKSLRDQVKFTFRRLEQNILKDQKATLLLEYSDNQEWLEGEIKPEIERRFPLVQVIMQLLSLTSAAHMGPGSWGIAFLTENPKKDDSYV